MRYPRPRGVLLLLHALCCCDGFLNPIFSRFDIQSRSLANSIQPTTTTTLEVLSESKIRDVLEELYPSGKGYIERLRMGRVAQGFLGAEGQALDDVRLPGGGSLTYGEYPWQFVCDLVNECLDLSGGPEKASELVFLDVGSGAGRLVIGQALSWPWKLSCGVEIVQSLHDTAEVALQKALVITKESNMRMAPVQLLLGDMTVPVEYGGVDFKGADIIFCYSSTWPAAGDLLTEASFALGTRLKKGAIVVTTDRLLESQPGVWGFEVISTHTSDNPETGGKSTAYIQRVTLSGIGRWQ